MKSRFQSSEENRGQNNKRLANKLRKTKRKFFFWTKQFFSKLLKNEMPFFQALCVVFGAISGGANEKGLTHEVSDMSDPLQFEFEHERLIFGSTKRAKLMFTFTIFYLLIQSNLHKKILWLSYPTARWTASEGEGMHRGRNVSQTAAGTDRTERGAVGEVGRRRCEAGQAVGRATRNTGQGNRRARVQELIFFLARIKCLVSII